MWNLHEAHTCDIGPDIYRDLKGVCSFAFPSPWSLTVVSDRPTCWYLMTNILGVLDDWFFNLDLIGSSFSVALSTHPTCEGFKLWSPMNTIQRGERRLNLHDGTYLNWPSYALFDFFFSWNCLLVKHLSMRSSLGRTYWGEFCEPCRIESACYYCLTWWDICHTCWQRQCYVPQCRTFYRACILTHRTSIYRWGNLWT